MESRQHNPDHNNIHDLNCDRVSQLSGKGKKRKEEAVGSFVGQTHFFHYEILGISSK